MKKILIITFAIIASNLINAQTGVLKNTTEIPVLTEEEYLKSANGWMIDIEKAYKESKKTGKPIMANFTGSEWCGWCKKLKAGVFVKPEFKKWADENVVLLFLDFPRRFKIPEKYVQQNYGLAKTFQISGYPTIWAFDLSKDEKGQFSIKGIGNTQTQFVNSVEGFTNFFDTAIKKSREAK